MRDLLNLKITYLHAATKKLTKSQCRLVAKCVVVIVVVVCPLRTNRRCHPISYVCKLRLAEILANFFPTPEAVAQAVAADAEEIERRRRRRRSRREEETKEESEEKESQAYCVVPQPFTFPSLLSKVPLLVATDRIVPQPFTSPLYYPRYHSKLLPTALSLNHSLSPLSIIQGATLSRYRPRCPSTLHFPPSLLSQVPLLVATDCIVHRPFTFPPLFYPRCHS